MELLGTTGKRIVLVGDSAGGNLVFSLALKVCSTYMGLGSYLRACGLLLYIEDSYCTYIMDSIYAKLDFNVHIACHLPYKPCIERRLYSQLKKWQHNVKSM